MKNYASLRLGDDLCAASDLVALLQETFQQGNIDLLNQALLQDTLPSESQTKGENVFFSLALKYANLSQDLPEELMSRINDNVLGKLLIKRSLRGSTIFFELLHLQSANLMIEILSNIPATELDFLANISQNRLGTLLPQALLRYTYNLKEDGQINLLLGLFFGKISSSTLASIISRPIGHGEKPFLELLYNGPLNISQKIEPILIEKAPLQVWDTIFTEVQFHAHDKTRVESTIQLKKDRSEKMAKYAIEKIINFLKDPKWKPTITDKCFFFFHIFHNTYYHQRILPKDLASLIDIIKEYEQISVNIKCDQSTNNLPLEENKPYPFHTDFLYRIENEVKKLIFQKKYSSNIYQSISPSQQAATDIESIINDCYTDDTSLLIKRLVCNR